MLKKIQLCLACASFAFVFSGCVARTYNLTRDRVDQNLESGNRGYLVGKPSAEELSKQRKLTRTTRIVEIEMGSQAKVGKSTTEKTYRSTYTPPARIQEDYTSSYTPPVIPRIERTEEVQSQAVEKYTVKEGDTLQKISQKFYGTTKKWYSIYKANQETLKGPNKIFPGQVINIPASSSGKSEEPGPGLK
jgi:nucleoid-associated protein YgaU